MGITIHYRGRLNDVGQLGRLCDELTDIAAAMGWKSRMLDDDWDQPADARLRHTASGAHIDDHLGLKGISITGEGAESLCFFFDREGNLRCPMGVILLLEGTLAPEDSWISVKTQFASPEVHAWIVGLLKYLKKHYISDLEVSDEGEYWETGDMRTLKAKMDFLNEKIAYLSDKLSSARLGDVSDLSPDELAMKIEELLLEDEHEPPETNDPGQST